MYDNKVIAACFSSLNYDNKRSEIWGSNLILLNITIIKRLKIMQTKKKKSIKEVQKIKKKQKEKENKNTVKKMKNI